MANSITVKFVDFWPTFDKENNKLVRALRARRSVTVLSDDNREEPDILFYSHCGYAGEHYKYNRAVKVFYTGENDYPNFNECDYAISFHDIDVAGRNLRYPLYALEFPSGNATEQALNQPEQRGFCSVVMSNSLECDPRRVEIIDAVNAYKPLAYGGSFRNNVGGRVADKESFLAQYKFNLALENSQLDGYVTEKIADSFLAHTVPIYWGGGRVSTDFNPESFINANDYHTLHSLVDAIREIDTDPAKYLAMLNAPSRIADTVADFDSRLEDFLDRIASNLPPPAPGGLHSAPTTAKWASSANIIPSSSPSLAAIFTSDFLEC